jgi:1,2-dihydroxy-3-keto-5-methylthiopentene dioxygenase
VLAAYAPELTGLRGRLRVRSVDRVQLQPDHAGWPALREQFTAEQTQADAEIRYFLGGTGLFHIRVAGGHLALLCEAGDWVALPAGTPYGFDAGAEPDVDALRLLGALDGGVALPTGAGTPALPLLDAFVEQLLALTGHAEDFCSQDAQDPQLADASYLIAAGGHQTGPTDDFSSI